MTKPKTQNEKTADPNKPKTLAEVLAMLPRVADHPTVKELTERRAKLSADLDAAQQKRRQIETDLASFGLSPARSAAEAEAARLAAGGDRNDGKLLGLRSAMEQANEDIAVLTRAVELVAQQITVATAEAAREHSPLVKELGMPFVRRCAMTLIDAALAHVQLHRLHTAVRRLGLSPYALATAIPPHPFSPQLFAPGVDAVPSSVRDLLTKLIAAGVFDEAERDTILAKFEAK